MNSGEADKFDWQQDKLVLPRGVTVREPQDGQYMIEDILGRGTFGIVYLGDSRK